MCTDIHYPGDEYIYICQTKVDDLFIILIKIKIGNRVHTVSVSVHNYVHLIQNTTQMSVCFEVMLIGFSMSTTLQRLS